MTFIIGFQCCDGIVLCGDSLESDGYTKRYVNKIETYTIGDEWGAAIGCAGRGDIIRKFWEKLTDVLGTELYDRPKLEAKVEKTIEILNKRHGAQIDVLLGLWSKSDLEAKLYRTYSGSHCLSPQPDYSCAGQDTTLANFIASTIHDPLVMTEEAAKLAVWITALQSEHADGVGGPINLIIHKKGDPCWRRAPAEYVAEIEQQLPIADAQWIFWKYWRETHPFIYKPPSFPRSRRSQGATPK